MKKVDVVLTARELAEIMKAEPNQVERALIEQGDRLIAFYEDGNFGESFQNLKTLKAEVLEMAIQDISSGVMTLRSSSIGVTFRGQSLSTYVSPHGTNPSGTVVFSLSWKNIKAFRNWRNEDGKDNVDQDQINTAIYRLSAALSKLI